MSFVCAIDLGTGSAKVCLVDDQGVIHRTKTVSYDVESSAPGYAETNPEQWWLAVCDGIRQVVAGREDRLVGVGIDGQMHGLVVHEQGRPIRPAILWADSRAIEQAERWRSLPEDLIAPLANPIVPGMFGPIMNWLVDNEPDLLAQATHACSPKDWIRGQLVGRHGVTDASDSSATLLWDVPNNRWHADLISGVGLPEGLLPEVAPSGSSAGETLAQGILPAGLPVSVGCADTAGTLVASQLEPEEVLVNLGTGIQVCQTGGHPVANAAPTCHTYADVQGGWYSMVAPQNGGLVLGRVLDWLGATWEELYATLDLPTHLGNPVFQPWAAPERLPTWRPGGQAGWTGLGLEHTRADLLRSALEAIAFQVRDAISALPRKPDAIRFAGGGNQNPRMRQLICNVTGLPGRMSTIKDSTTLGAARLGFEASGLGVEWSIPRQAEWVEPGGVH